MTLLWELGVVLLLILVNAVLSGAEIALVAVRRSRLEQLSGEGKRAARSVLLLKSDPERLLATIQIGITVVGATAAAFGGVSIAERLSVVLAGVPWLALYAYDVAIAAVIGFISFLSIVVGELVPKSLALRGAERYALFIGRPVLYLSWLVRPLVWLLTASSNLVLRPFRDRTTFIEAKYSAEELHELVGEAARVGTVHPEAGAIASRALEFADLRALDVMIPRQEVVFLPRGTSLVELQRILLEHTHTRMPVFERTLDNVIGYVNVKDILSVAWDPALFILEDVLRPAYFVPETLRALDLMREMRERHMLFAIVTDDQGGTAGIVTMEDLVEELVGEIFSEHTRDVPALVRREPSGTALVSGTAPVRDVNRELAIDLPEGQDYSTLAGLALAIAGRIPRVGERIVVPQKALLEIVDATARRVRTIRVIPSLNVERESE